jgi:hypothetical protein
MNIFFTKNKVSLGEHNIHTSDRRLSVKNKDTEKYPVIIWLVLALIIHTVVPSNYIHGSLLVKLSVPFYTGKQKYLTVQGQTS